MKNWIFLFLLAGFSQLGAQASMDNFYAIDASHSYLGFEVQYMGYAKVKGRFESFKGVLYYQEGQVGKTSVSVEASANSIDTDLEWRDNDLRSANWFDAEQFPALSFQSKKVLPGKEGFELIGLLRIKDVEKEVRFYMGPPSGVLTDIRGDKQVIFTGYTEIDRTDFGVEGKNWSKVKEGITAVGNTVKLEISILGKQFQEGNLLNFVRNPQSPPGKLYLAYQEGGFTQLETTFSTLKQDTSIRLNAQALNIVGYLLIRQEQVASALSIFQLNQTAFPEVSNVYDSLGEAYARLGQTKEAKASYETALQKDPSNMSAREKLRHLR